MFISLKKVNVVVIGNNFINTVILFMILHVLIYSIKDIYVH